MGIVEDFSIVLFVVWFNWHRNGRLGVDYPTATRHRQCRAIRMAPSCNQSGAINIQ